jgi:hypothetical protein
MSFSNIALFIKRAEIYHSKEYIIEILRNLNYGEVSDVQFIKKTNFTTGQEYNGAIVTFKRWFMNSHVQILFDQMNTSTDRTAKITHDKYGQRYWVVCHHKSLPAVPAQTTVNPDLPDKIRIEELEKLVASMTAQMHFFQLQQEKTEQKFMEYENKEIHALLVNAELRSQLKEKDYEIQQDLQSELTNTRLHAIELRRQVETTRFELEEKKIECEDLREELYEERNILAYIHAQANEMRDMLHIDIKPLKGKMTIEELM